jgi:hypothetical protein
VPASKRTADFCAISAKRLVTAILYIRENKKSVGKRREERLKKLKFKKTSVLVARFFLSVSLEKTCADFVT